MSAGGARAVCGDEGKIISNPVLGCAQTCTDDQSEENTSHEQDGIKRGGRHLYLLTNNKI